MPPSPPDDVVVFGGAAWSSPWLTEHHLAHALAKQSRVLYIDPPNSPISVLRGGDLRQGLRRLSERVRGALLEDEGVVVAAPLVLPPVRDARARRLSAPTLRRQTARAVRRRDLRPGLLLAARGIPEGLPSRLEAPFRVALVKDWLQAGTHLTGLDAASLRARELASWRAADLVCAVSTRLQERLAQDGIPSALLRHGFDQEQVSRFERAVEHPVRALDALPRPIFGYAGRIDDRSAFGPLLELARRHRTGSLVLVGPLSPLVDRMQLGALLAEPNVHHLGPVPKRELPSWISRFDCALVPYLDDEWQRYASPIKVWDYLYSGVPIAATGSPALGELPDGVVHFSLEATELATVVDRALGEDREVGIRARRDFALANTWDDRARELRALVQERTT